MDKLTVIQAAAYAAGSVARLGGMKCVVVLVDTADGKTACGGSCTFEQMQRLLRFANEKISRGDEMARLPCPGDWSDEPEPSKGG